MARTFKVWGWFGYEKTGNINDESYQKNTRHTIPAPFFCLAQFQRNSRKHHLCLSFVYAYLEFSIFKQNVLLKKYK